MNEKKRLPLLEESFFCRTFALKMEYAATIGFFDGVHRGHLYLLSQLRQQAARSGVGAMAVTFRQHPRQLITGVNVPLLTSEQERISLLQSQVEQVAELDFTAVRSLSAEDFLRFLRSDYGVRLLLMGYDHRFGSDRLSSPEDYAACGRRAGVEVLTVPQAPEGAVSSSKIRKALEEGDVVSAGTMLGRPYSIEGEVVHGRGLGRTLGFPTANIQPSEPCLLIPRNGVYAAEVLSGGQTWRAVVNIGTNPTIGNNRQTIEAHLLDYEGESLYGATLVLRFLRRLRDERRFDSMDALCRQIRQDIQSL